MTARREPVWLDAKLALPIHDRQLAEHGGGPGTRDPALLESALARPMNRWGYGEDDRCALAAAYAFGIARNHPFVDGNKRTAWVFARLFLALNGSRAALRAGRMRSEPSSRWPPESSSEEAMTQWLSERAQPADGS